MRTHTQKPSNKVESTKQIHIKTSRFNLVKKSHDKCKITCSGLTGEQASSIIHELKNEPQNTFLLKFSGMEGIR